MILVHFQGKPFNTTVIQVCAPITDAEEAEVEWSYEDLDLLELTAKQRYHFHHRGLECKLGSQEIPDVTDMFALEVQNEAGQRLTEFFQENALVQANTLFQQWKRQLYTWTSPNGRY